MAKAGKDYDLFPSLCDLIEQEGDNGSPLDDPDELTDAAAVSDGNAILDDVYGSRNDAMVALRKAAPDLAERELSKLAPISATAVVAALAQANRPMMAAAPLPAAQESGGGILGSIIGAVISGAVSGAMRELKPKTRRRSRYTTSRSRRRTRAGRRPSSAKSGKTSKALEDMFRDILGNIVK